MRKELKRAGARRDEPRKGFTLVELMVVVVIIAILVMVAAPVFQGATRGGALRSASFTFSTALTLARQAAITQRQYIYVIIPDNNPALFSANPREAEKAYKAFAPYSRKDGYMAEWTMLPPGIVFNPTFAVGLAATRNIFVKDALIDDLPFPLNNSALFKLHATCYRPDGATTLGNTPFAIYMGEGITETDLNAGTASAPVIKPNTPTMEFNVHPLTGRIRTREYTQ